MITSAMIGSVLSLIFGACVGAQREMRRQQEKKPDIAGFRTFSLTSVLGFLVGFLTLLTQINEILFLILFGFFGFCIVAYFQMNRRDSALQSISMITVISLVLVFIIGILVAYKYYYLSAVLTLMITAMLFLGDSLHKFAKRLTVKEVFASLKFALISIVILPLLPNYNYSLAEMGFFTKALISFGISEAFLLQIDVFNPFKIWLLVVFISSIAYVGYIMMKLLGTKKGILLTGFLGGLMSSTALTTSFAIESKKMPKLSIPLAIGIIIACSTMFFRVLFEVLVVYPELFFSLIVVLGSMGIVGYICALYLYNKFKIDHIKQVDTSSPFSLKPALEFTLFFVLIAFLAELFIIFFGDKGIYFLSFFSGFADVDPMTLSLANLAKQGDITHSVATIGITLAAFSNTLVKGGIAWFLGSRELKSKIAWVFLLIILCGILLLFS